MIKLVLYLLEIVKFSLFLGILFLPLILGIHALFILVTCIPAFFILNVVHSFIEQLEKGIFINER